MKRIIALESSSLTRSLRFSVHITLAPRQPQSFLRFFSVNPVSSESLSSVSPSSSSPSLPPPLKPKPLSSSSPSSSSSTSIEIDTTPLAQMRTLRRIYSLNLAVITALLLIAWNTSVGASWSVFAGEEIEEMHDKLNQVVNANTDPKNTALGQSIDELRNELLVLSMKEQRHANEVKEELKALHSVLEQLRRERVAVAAHSPFSSSSARSEGEPGAAAVKE